MEAIRHKVDELAPQSSHTDLRVLASGDGLAVHPLHVAIFTVIVTTVPGFAGECALIGDLRREERGCAPQRQPDRFRG